MNDTNQPSAEATAQPEVPRRPTTVPNLWKLPERLLQSDLFHPCVQDLFSRGPAGARGVPGEPRASRSTIVHYLARWSRSAGLTQEESLEWLIDYATEALVVISTSSLSEIRHNIRGIVKFIYRTADGFDCQKANNLIQCRCDADCPVYLLPPPPKLAYNPPPQTTPSLGGVKEFYRNRYSQSLQCIRDMRAARCTAPEIVTRLNSEGFHTKTGKKWTTGLLSRTVKSEGMDRKPKLEEVRARIEITLSVADASVPPS